MTAVHWQQGAPFVPPSEFLAADASHKAPHIVAEIALTGNHRVHAQADARLRIIPTLRSPLGVPAPTNRVPMTAGGAGPAQHERPSVREGFKQGGVARFLRTNAKIISLIRPFPASVRARARCGSICAVQPEQCGDGNLPVV